MNIPLSYLDVAYLKGDSIRLHVRHAILTPTSGNLAKQIWHFCVIYEDWKTCTDKSKCNYCKYTSSTKLVFFDFHEHKTFFFNNTLLLQFQSLYSPTVIWYRCNKPNKDIINTKSALIFMILLSNSALVLLNRLSHRGWYYYIETIKHAYPLCNNCPSGCVQSYKDGHLMSVLFLYFLSNVLIVSIWCFLVFNYIHIHWLGWAMIKCA